jgi:hypothetical protein
LDQLQLQQNNHMTGASKAEIKRKVKEIPDWLVSIQYSDGTIIVGNIACWNICHRNGYEQSPNWESELSDSEWRNLMSRFDAEEG